MSLAPRPLHRGAGSVGCPRSTSRSADGARMGRMSPPPQLATFGAGCFWCFDAVARRLPGVESSVTGYAGGSGEAPTYRDVHQSYFGGRKNRQASQWVEAVQVSFRPAVISYRTLIDLMFRTHDPTAPHQDGANHGPEYHSTIYVHTEDQAREADSAVSAWSHSLGRPIVTSVIPFSTFVPAEDEHQDFYGANPSHPYCKYVIIPKLAKVFDDPKGYHGSGGQ